MPLWGELKRRNVFKVGMAYLLVAWLIAQVVSVASQPLGLPDWFEPAVLVLLAVGFMVALLLAWAYELTPEGIKKTRHVPLEDSLRHLTGQKLNYIVTALLVPVVGFLVLDAHWLGGLAQAPATVAPEAAASAPSSDPGPVVPAVLPNSIAVLPFANLSPDPNNEFFAAGIHDEILNQLAKLRNLSVIARTSVLQYANVAKPITEIARELNVGTIMEGSVSYAEGRVAVRVQLIDAGNGIHLWSESYNREFADIFGIQADIAMNIANALEAEFSGAEQARIESVPTESSEAYALFLAALALDGPGQTERRLDLFEQAVAIDPEFALGHAAIAWSLATTTLNIITSDATRAWNDTGALAIASAERALDLDPDLANAHLALALMYEITWRWSEARAAYRRAYELNASNPNVLWRYTWFNSFSGQHAEALRLADRFRRLQPNNVGALINASLAYAHVGDLEAAQSACERAVALDPGALLCQHALGLLHARVGNGAAAERQFRLVERVLGDNRFIAFTSQLAIGYSLLGLEQDAARIVAEIEAGTATADIGAGALATTYLGAGDRERLRESLEAAIAKVEAHEADAGYYDLMNIRNNVYEHPMLEEPPFPELRARLGEL